MEVTRLIVEDFPSAEMVVFGKNGSDACTVAARLARIATGKRTILSCGFHGWQDFALEHFSFAMSGIPRSDRKPVFHKFRFNDREDFFRLFQEHRGDLAAVMIEPAGPFIRPETGMGGDADAAFLAEIAEAARRANALLVFDEIITGYRYRQGSVQRATGIVPDLTCLGKAIASGMPLSAVAGSARIFHAAFAKTHYCPTFKGEVYSFAAAKAAIEIYRSEPIVEHIWQHGKQLRERHSPTRVRLRTGRRMQGSSVSHGRALSRRARASMPEADAVHAGTAQGRRDHGQRRHAAKLRSRCGRHGSCARGDRRGVRGRGVG